VTADLRGIRLAVLTLSDSVSGGHSKDLSGEVIARTLTGLGADVIASDVLPDDHPRIVAKLMSYADELSADLVLTTGGSGVAPRDVTPEATLQVVDRLVPGLVEAARIQTLHKTPMAMVSRSVAGIRGRTLIINLPGSPKAVQEWLEILLPVLRHAVDLLRGTSTRHP
jgi:molybdopterin adenylyltransferase